MRTADGPDIRMAVWETVSQSGDWAAFEKRRAAKLAKEDAAEEADIQKRAARKKKWEESQTQQKPKGKYDPVQKQLYGRSV